MVRKNVGMCSQEVPTYTVRRVLCLTLRVTQCDKTTQEGSIIIQFNEMSLPWQSLIPYSSEIDIRICEYLRFK